MYDTLKQQINDTIKANGKRQITGTNLNQVLNAIVSELGEEGASLGGFVTPSQEISESEGNIFYIASEAGTYTNFDDIVVGANEIAFLYKANGEWTKASVPTYVKPSNGIPSTDLDSSVQTSLGKADTALQQEDIAEIESVIPAEADKDNKLADKNYVDTNISTASATFRGTSAADLTEQQFIAWANALTKDNNDYVFWNTVDSDGDEIYKRYKWNGTQWSYEFTLSNTDKAILYKEQNLTDQQRNTALANVSNQTANSTTGKVGYKVLQPEKPGDSTTGFAAQIAGLTNTIFEIRDVFDLNLSPSMEALNCDETKTITYTFKDESTYIDTIYYSTTPIVVDDTNYIVVKKGQVLLKDEYSGGTTTGNRIVVFESISEGYVYSTYGTYYLGHRTDNDVIYNHVTPILLPLNTKLKFNGGMLKNCTIVGNQSEILAEGKIFDNVNIEGRWTCKGNAAWWCIGCPTSQQQIVSSKDYLYRVIRDGYDQYEAIQQALDSAFSELVFPQGLYYTTRTLKLTKQKRVVLDGQGIPTYLFQGLESLEDACVIFTDQNINLLEIGGTRSTYVLKYEVVGGTFDTSLSGSTIYDKNCISLSASCGTKLSEVRIETSIYGCYWGNTVPRGKGISVAYKEDLGENVFDCAASYITCVQIKAKIRNFGECVAAYSNMKPKEDEKFWMTDVFVDKECYLEYFKNAVVMGTNGTVGGSMQPQAFFSSDNKEAAIIVLFDNYVSISGRVWDTGKEGKNGLYNNNYALDIRNSNATVIAEGEFTQTNSILGYTERVYNINKIHDYIHNGGDRLNLGYSELYDSLLGFDLLGIGTTTFTLHREGVGDIDITSANISNIYRNDSKGCSLSTGGDPLGKDDYYKITIEINSDSQYQYCSRLNRVLLFYRVTNALTAEGTCMCKWYLSSGATTSKTKNYVTFDVNNTSGFVKDYYLDFYTTVDSAFKKIEFIIQGEGLGNFPIIRLSANNYLRGFEGSTNGTGIYEIGTWLSQPFISRCGGDLFGNLNTNGLLLLNQSTGLKSKNEIEESNGYILPTYKAGNTNTTSNLIGFQPTSGNPIAFSYYITGTANLYVSSTFTFCKSLYCVSFFGNGDTSDGMGFEVVKIFGNYDLTFKLYYNSSSTPPYYIQIISPGYKPRISIINPDECLSLSSLKAAPTGYTERTVGYGSGTKYRLLKNYGTTSERAVVPNVNYIPIGYQYFDTDLGKMIVWNGTAWINLDGTALS